MARDRHRHGRVRFRPGAGRPRTTPGSGSRPTAWCTAATRPCSRGPRCGCAGVHNGRNLCVGAGRAGRHRASTCREPAVAEAVASFEGLPHRLTEIEDPSGLTFVDDTLSTSPYSAMHAIDAYEGRPLTVLVGGTDRGLDYAPLREHLRGSGADRDRHPGQRPAHPGRAGRAAGRAYRGGRGPARGGPPGPQAHARRAAWCCCRRPRRATAGTATSSTAPRSSSRPSAPAPGRTPGPRLHGRCRAPTGLDQPMTPLGRTADAKPVKSGYICRRSYCKGYFRIDGRQLARAGPIHRCAQVTV